MIALIFFCLVFLFFLKIFVSLNYSISARNRPILDFFVFFFFVFLATSILLQFELVVSWNVAYECFTDISFLYFLRIPFILVIAELSLLGSHIFLRIFTRHMLEIQVNHKPKFSMIIWRIGKGDTMIEGHIGAA